MLSGALIGWMFVFSAGCGQSNLAFVQGTVTLDGVALPGATVEFVPIDGRGNSSYGRTDARGRYQMHSSRDRSGAWVGENTVRISTADVLEVNGGEQVAAELVPARYNEGSQVVAQVEPGSNRFDFQLSSNDTDGNQRSSN